MDGLYCFRHSKWAKLLSTVAEVLDGEVLKCTFRRWFSPRLLRAWEEIIQLASTICFTGDEDSVIWQYISNGVYSTQSLYRIVNFRGVTPVYTPAVWSLYVPPRIHVFLWLVSKNKLLTRDNLAKRKHTSSFLWLLCGQTDLDRVSCNHWLN